MDEDVLHVLGERPALEHGREVKAQDPGANAHAAPNRLLERLARLLREPEAADRLKALQLVAQAG